MSTTPPPASPPGSTVAEVLAAAARRLDAVTETPRLDAEILLAHALGLSRSRLLARLRDSCKAPAFEALLERRLAYEPIAYIVGTWEFFSLEFTTRRPMLVPRPETEHLVEVAIEYLATQSRPVSPPLRVLDLGTGTGCVAIAIAKNAPGAAVTATDCNPDALALAQENAHRHGTGITFLQGDLFQALPPDTPPLDVIVSNPPYVEDGDWDALSPVIRLHEDPRALLAGPDGLDVVRRIVQDAPQWLVPGGLLALEIGERQQGSVRELFEQVGYLDAGFRPDLAGIPRILHAKCGRS